MLNENAGYFTKKKIFIFVDVHQTFSEPKLKNVSIIFSKDLFLNLN